ncbi:MAG: hypothetical protein HOA57_03245 [Candidatus Magasanikbacteria bacterium]|nr:hypothetical protein [Candidatus Magasanikbacteria bacterium]MBT4315010.1 hypothetical protein [Candidatus Magasanikbacteria bacterium]MBT4547023.1 hypothetical protein [Candidatus Magasanikbacteria bacterium]MBT6819367.1 hypothetical protein [Candidatus Magasanikbacteria bacterium]
MNNEKITLALNGYGLDSKEIKVFLALLELGVGNGHEIASKSGIIRTTTYSVLEELIRKGLVTEVKKGRIKHYTIEDPRKIIDEMEERNNLIKQVKGDLLSMYQTAEHRPMVRFYKGLSAIKELHNNILKEKGLKEYDILTAETDWLQLDEKFFSDFLQRRADKGIKTRLIIDSKSINLKHQKKNYDLKREVKYLPTEHQGAFTSEIYIMPRKVIFIAEKKELLAVEIESMDIVEAQRFMFNFLWNNIK